MSRIDIEGGGVRFPSGRPIERFPLDEGVLIYEDRKLSWNQVVVAVDPAPDAYSSPVFFVHHVATFRTRVLIAQDRKHIMDKLRDALRVRLCGCVEKPVAAAGDYGLVFPYDILCPMHKRALDQQWHGDGGIAERGSADER